MLNFLQEHLFDVSDLQHDNSLISKCGSLEVSFYYDSKNTRMVVKIHQAREIPAKDRGGANTTQVTVVGGGWCGDWVHINLLSELSSCRTGAGPIHLRCQISLVVGQGRGLYGSDIRTLWLWDFYISDVRNLYLWYRCGVKTSQITVLSSCAVGAGPICPR